MGVFFRKRDKIKELKFELENTNSLLKAEKALNNRLEIKLHSIERELKEANATIIEAAGMVSDIKEENFTLKKENQRLELENVFAKNKVN